MIKKLKKRFITFFLPPLVPSSMILMLSQPSKLTLTLFVDTFSYTTIVAVSIICSKSAELLLIMESNSSRASMDMKIQLGENRINVAENRHKK